MWLFIFATYDFGDLILWFFFFSLREMDIELMRRLSPRVNVIPVIGKADSLTPSELRGFKKRVSGFFIPSISGF
jgi:septin family protein